MTSNKLGQGISGAWAPVRKATSDVSSRWRNAPKWARIAGYLLLVVLAVLLPSQTVGNIMAPQSDWRTVLFYPIGSYILLALGLNVVVGLAPFSAPFLS